MTAASGIVDDDVGIEVSADGPILTVTLARPSRLNAISPEMHLAMQEAFDRFEADDSLRVAILTATGRAFCVGSDLKAAAERRSRGEGPLALPPGGYGGIASRFGRTKPLIAAINGDAYGGGLELALACDLVVMADTARLSLPEPGFGMVAIGGGPHRLIRAVGSKRAMDIALTGRRLTAVEALEFGLVNRVVAIDALADAAHELAVTLLRCGPGALATTMQMVDTSLDYPSLEEALARQEYASAMQRWRASDEALEGARAFAEKREPAWRA